VLFADVRFGVPTNSVANLPIPPGSVGTVTRIDSDDALRVDFGAALNADKIIVRHLFHQIERVSERVRVGCVICFGSHVRKT
jgi:hypothetical protein